jgi:hypothetical protein
MSSSLTLLLTHGPSRAQLSVIVRDLQSGKMLREYPLGRHEQFFDRSNVAVVDARDGWVDVAGQFTVLD